MPIDQLTFHFTVLKGPPEEEFSTGAVVDGLFLEGARWSIADQRLEEALPRRLHDNMPPVSLKIRYPLAPF